VAVKNVSSVSCEKDQTMFAASTSAGS